MMCQVGGAEELVTGQRRILVIGPTDDQRDSLVERLKDQYEVVVPDSLHTGLMELQRGQFSGVVLVDADAAWNGLILEAGGILEQIPDGIVLLDPSLSIVWANRQLYTLTGRTESLLGSNFYEAFGTPEILGPDFCPFNTALGSGESAHSTLRVGEKSYFEVHAKPIHEKQNESPPYLIVIVRDVSGEVLQRQKLNAIYQAGLELGDLSPQEILEMSVSDRIELLKSKILHYTKDLLEFETVEIRLVDKRTKRLEPLLAVGMQPAAANRLLFAEPQGNGVTGFVAATGKSYLCEDTANDPLYLPGALGARSSLTVPLVLHDEILGTFNVESPNPGAFSENDLQFLELFSREIAVALNTLELLVAEKMTTASESTEKILRGVAQSRRRNPERHGSHSRTLHRPRPERLGAAAANSQKHARHQAIDSQSGPDDGSQGDVLAVARRVRSGRSSKASGSWSPTATKRFAQRLTSCWGGSAAKSKRPITAKKRS